MAIAYLPSVGNIAKVGLNQQGIWFGESTGGAVVEKVRTETLENRGNYFIDVPANLSSVSSWFLKDATDYNFQNGITIYRAIYIGADKNFRENEILGNIDTNISHNGPSLADNSVDVDILFDGKYTELTSRNSTVLDNEKDTTQVISNRTGWSKTVNYSPVLFPGEYIKLWIRIAFKKETSLLDIHNYTYFLSIKDLTVPFYRIKGRLNTSKVFSTKLDSKDIVLRASLPQEVPTENIYKIIEHNNLTHVFYYEDETNSPGDMTILIIQRSNIIENNKYIQVNLTELAPNIINDKTFYQHFSECCSSGTTGTTGTPTLPTSSDPCVFKPLSDQFDSFIGNRYLVDILGTNKKEKNSYYLFFNTFTSDQTDEFITLYGHKNYYWNTGIVNIDLDFITDNYFRDIETGFDSRLKITPIDNKEYLVRERLYTKNSIIQDDLLSCIGIITEDCRKIDHLTTLYHIWEGDIINENIKLHYSIIPQVSSNEIITIEQKTNSQTPLLFNTTIVDTVNLGFTRETKVLNTDAPYIRMGPPHQKRFDHGYSEVSYDIDANLDDFSTTWSFGVHEKSIISDTISTTGTTGTTGVPFSCGITGQNIECNPNQYHVMYQEDYPNTGIDYQNKHIDEFISIFNLHCNSNEQAYALKVLYNWYQNIWRIVSRNESNQEYFIDIENGPYISTTFDNVITLNVHRAQRYGCYKKFIIQYSIHINGTELLNSNTYTMETTDTYVVTHNPENDFSGYLSYWEVKNYLNNEAEIYSKAMYRILSNVAWAELKVEQDNSNSLETDLKYFNFKRNIQIKNLEWNSNETLVFPIVLQGTGYNIDSEYNKEVRRSVFDFTRIDVNNKSFAFTYAGTTNKLDWISDSFNVDKDILVLWVRLENWNGQDITMYYSDSRIIQDTEIIENPYKDYYSIWHMDRIIRVPSRRFISNQLYDGGEILLTSIDPKNNISLLEITKPYVNGYHNYYKSNKFDIRWNEIDYDRDEVNEINSFLKNTIRDLKPNYMEVDIVTSTNDYIIEADTNKE